MIRPNTPPVVAAMTDKQPTVDFANEQLVRQPMRVRGLAIPSNLTVSRMPMNVPNPSPAFGRRHVDPTQELFPSHRLLAQLSLLQNTSNLYYVTSLHGRTDSPIAGLPGLVLRHHATQNV